MAGKADIAEHLASAQGMSRRQAGEVLDIIFHKVTDVLGGGERVQIPGFGAFIVTETKARTGINPQSKQPMQIPAGKRVRFKPGKVLKDAVNG